jgi:hypothetical protein
MYHYLNSVIYVYGSRDWSSMNVAGFTHSVPNPSPPVETLRGSLTFWSHLKSVRSAKSICNKQEKNEFYDAVTLMEIIFNYYLFYEQPFQCISIYR